MFEKNSIANFNLSYYFRRAYIERVAKDNQFTFLGEGRHRRTYLTKSKKCVIKFPYNSDGLKANQSEHDNYHKYKKNNDTYGIVYAPCRLIKDTVLLMPYIDLIFGFEDGEELANEKDISLPSWAYKIDCHQVGLFKGRFVAYDSYEGDY